MNHKNFLNMFVKENKSRYLIRITMFLTWLLVWIIVPFRVIRPFFFDKFIYLRDPEYGYKIINGDICSADLNTDGFRDKKFTLKEEDEFLILVIGDSIVYGKGLLVKDRFTNLLESKLNKIKKTRVFNLGKCGSNLYQNYIREEKFRTKLNPDLIVFAVSDGDLLIDESLKDSPFSDNEILGMKIVYNVKSEGESAEYIKRVSASFDEDSVNYSMLLDIIPKMPEDKTLYYFLTYYKPAFMHHKIIDVFNRNNYYIIDNFILYLSKYGKYAREGSGLIISRKETHPNFIANQMFAERLYQEITSNSRWGFVKR